MALDLALPHKQPPAPSVTASVDPSPDVAAPNHQGAPQKTDAQPGIDKHDAAPAASSDPASAGPEGRSTSFQAVQGSHDLQSGERLLVEAYAVLWIILFVFLVLTTRRQRAIDARIEDLQEELKRARKEQEAKGDA